MTDAAIEKPETAPENSMPARKPRSPRGRVVIFGMWCKGCGICVEFCPAGVLALGDDDHPIVIAPENCTACHWCDTHCPDLAILVNPIGNEGGKA
jgi:2-oxoglutarate ferredoxin oxidoreductase subunit delta